MIKRTEQVRATAESVYFGWNNRLEFTTADGDTIDIHVSNELLRDLGQKVKYRIEEQDKEALAEAREKLELEASEES